MNTQDYINRLHKYNINIQVVEEYKNCSTPIAHICPVCNRTDWLVQPQHVWSRRATKCNRCAGRNEWDAVKYSNEALKYNIKVVGKYINTITAIEHICPSCGREDWMVIPNTVIQGKARFCKQCADNLRKAFTPMQYKETVYNKFNIIVLDNYINNYTPIRHICPMCNRNDWKVAPHDLLRRGFCVCNKCIQNSKESVLAYVLKQVACKEFSSAIEEFDAGFRGPSGRISLYDIYIPELNLLIECQSEFHDSEIRQRIDKDKKEFAIKHGYKFLALDSRKVGILDAIQMLLPHINSIPKYIDLSRNSKDSNIVHAQTMLDNGYSIRDIAEITGYKTKTLYTYIGNGKLKKKQ